ncbi:MAG: vitamin K epoxide reductase family protein [Micromonosporaceae bacterium]
MAGTRPARRKGQRQGQGNARRQAQGKTQRNGKDGASANRRGAAPPRGDARPPSARGNGATVTAGKGAAAKGMARADARPNLAKRLAAPVSGAPSWFQLTTLALSLVGLGISIYLTIVHYSTSVGLACPNTGTVNCEKVITSPESYVFGIPVAVLGLAFYVFLVAINNPLAWRSRFPLLHQARVLSVVVGMGFVIYLIYVELFKVNAICLWCTGVHVATFALFLLIVFGAAIWGIPARDDR